MKGYIHSFHMGYRRLISNHRLQRKINIGPLSFSSLVKQARVFGNTVHLLGGPSPSMQMSFMECSLMR